MDGGFALLNASFLACRVGVEVGELYIVKEAYSSLWCLLHLLALSTTTTTTTTNHPASQPASQLVIQLAKQMMMMMMIYYKI